MVRAAPVVKSSQNTMITRGAECPGGCQVTRRLLYERPKWQQMPSGQEGQVVRRASDSKEDVELPQGTEWPREGAD